MTCKIGVRTAFSRAANQYDEHAILQREVADRLFDHLLPMRLKPGVILDAGCGTGYARAFFRKRFKRAQLFELDLSLQMLKQACQSHRRNVFWEWMTRFNDPMPVQLCSDIEALPLLNDAVDLIWSSLAFQWCASYETVFSECFRVLRPDGLLLFATLGPDTLKELRHAFTGLDSNAHVNSFVDMHHLGDSLLQAGFSGPVMDVEHLTLTYSDLASIIRDLKAVGANAMDRHPGLWGRKAWQKVQTRYEIFRKDGMLPVTYEVIFGHAWKPQPTMSTHLPGAQQTIQFYPSLPKRRNTSA